MSLFTPQNWPLGGLMPNQPMVPTQEAFAHSQFIAAQQNAMAQQQNNAQQMSAYYRDLRNSLCGLTGLHRGKSKVDIARERFGQKFAHEPGATWRPRTVPVLTEWLQSRGRT